MARLTPLERALKAHEETSRLAINEVKDAVASSNDKAQVRHEQILGVLALHGAKIDVHEHRITQTEKDVSEVRADRVEARRGWQRWALGILAAVLSAGLVALATLGIRAGSLSP